MMIFIYKLWIKTTTDELSPYRQTVERRRSNKDVVVSQLLVFIISVHQKKSLHVVGWQGM